MATSLPSYLQGQPWQNAQQYQAKLPVMFNTNALQKSYGNLQQQTFNQGRALAAAAANQYTQRAQQAGASTLGAGFAEASAMLPIYGQQAQLQSDLASKQLQFRGQQAQIGAGLAGTIGQLKQGQQSTYADYFLRQQQLQQQQQQFGQTYSLQERAQASNEKNDRLKALQLAMQTPRSSYSYATGMGGLPMTARDQQQMQASQSQEQFFSNLRNQLGGFLG